MSLTTKLPVNYYSASNADGSITTSRFGANTDAHAQAKLRTMLADVGASITDVTLYRHEATGGRTNYIPVPAV